MVSVSEPSPSGALFPTFHYGALSGAKNAGNRVENPGIQEILIHRGESHYGISSTYVFSLILNPFLYSVFIFYYYFLSSRKDSYPPSLIFSTSEPSPVSIICPLTHT